MKKILLLIILFVIKFSQSKCQVPDCFELKSGLLEFNNDEIITNYTKQAMPTIGVENFVKQSFILYPESHGKIFVEFLVDTLGQVKCPSVVKSDNVLLDSQAIFIIERTKFEPAEQSGKKLLSLTVFPIFFGPELSNYKRRKNEKKKKVSAP